jgi:hypothetical protein
MISESSFQNRSLSRTLYETALDRVQHALSSTLSREFSQCQFGIAPGADGKRMLFVIADSGSQVEQLSLHIEAISREVARLLPGVNRVALCIRPIGDDAESRDRSPRQVVGRIFDLHADDI